MSLNDWDTAEDLLSSSILLLRSNNDDSNDKRMAELGAIITCSYRTYLLSETLLSSSSSSSSSAADVASQPSSLPNMITIKEIENCENVRVQIGENDVIPGLELGLRYAHIGDKFKIRVSNRFAYGPKGRSNSTPNNNNNNDNDDSIPPDSNLEYDVIIHNIIFNPEEYNIIEAITLRKECGNRWFSYNDFIKAAHAYSKGVKIAEANLTDENDSNHDIIQALYVACLNNLAACHLSAAQFSKAKEICIRVLELEPNNIKALLRAARTSLALHDYEECDLCLQLVLKLEPNNQQALIEIKKLKKAKYDYKISANNMAMKMAKSIFTPPKTNLVKVPNESINTTDTHDDNTNADINDTTNADIDTRTDTKTDTIADTDTNANDLAKVKAAKAAAPSNLILFLVTSLLVVVISIIIAIYISQKSD